MPAAVAAAAEQEHSAADGVADVRAADASETPAGGKPAISAAAAADGGETGSEKTSPADVQGSYAQQKTQHGGAAVEEEVLSTSR